MVATTTGGTPVQTLRKHKRATGLDFKELYGKEDADTFLLLESGRADAFVMDGQILASSIANSKNPAGFKIVGEPISVEPLAIMIRKNDPALRRLGDEVIDRLARTGEIERLYDKWFMQPISPRNIMLNLSPSAATRAAWANPSAKPLEELSKEN